jgi:hypothetical protein
MACTEVQHQLSHTFHIGTDFLFLWCNHLYAGGGGGDGTPGQIGQIGQPAKPNVVSLLSVPGQDVFIVNPKDEGASPYFMRLGDNGVSVNLYALVLYILKLVVL